jgi:hypothetical protein
MAGHATWVTSLHIVTAHATLDIPSRILGMKASTGTAAEDYEACL